MKKILLVLFAFTYAISVNSQAPDFTLTDVNGNSHSLYADYLDQGKTVFISVGAVWNPWDSVWVESGVMDDFQAQYGNDGVVMFIEGDPGTPESDLYGTGPSGTNEPESHGFFNYYIDQLPDLPDGSVFTNSAGIYFDFNDPVITNTARHTVDYNIVSNREIKANSLGFSLSPNPASDIIRISVDDQTIQHGQYDLMNLHGQQIVHGLFTGSKFEVPVETLSPGIYFLRVSDADGKVGARKVVVR